MITRVYLGNPAGPFGMQPIPAIRLGGSIGGTNAGMSPTMSRATVAHALMSGGTAVTMRRLVKSTYPIIWLFRGPADIDLLQSFFDGRQGSGPWCLVDPTWANQLPANVASLGSVINGLPEWSVNSPQTLVTSTTAGPSGLLSGVAVWHGAGSASLLYLGGTYGSTDGSLLPPVLAGQPHTFTIWARVASGSPSVTAKIGYGVAGAAPGGTAASGTAVTLSTTWQPVTVTVAAGFSWPAGSNYAVPQLSCGTASAPDIQLAAASFTYDTAAPSPWGTGVGVPRVVIAADVPSPVGRIGMRDYTLTLAEI